jgi:transcriptional regulator with XRE-family HTH domain
MQVVISLIFQERLKYLRSKRGITQEQLAVALDIPPTTIRRLETVNSLPRRDRLDAIADFFNVSVDYLLGRTDDETPLQRNNPRSIDQLSFDDDINIAIFGGRKEELTEEEAAHLEESLEMFRLLKAKKLAEQNKKK